MSGYDITLIDGDPTPGDPGLDQGTVGVDRIYLAKWPKRFPDFVALDGYDVSWTAVNAVDDVELAARLIADEWAVSTVNGDAVPALTGPTVTLGPVDVAAGDVLTFDLQPLMALIADNSETWNGVELYRIDTGPDLRLWGFGSTGPVAPVVESDFSDVLPEPTRLSPGGGRAVSVWQPLFRALDYAAGLDARRLQAGKLQWWATDPGSDFSDPNGELEVSTTVAEIPTAGTAFELPHLSPFGDNALRYYRIAFQPVAGPYGPWSAVESTRYRALGTMTINDDPVSLVPNPFRTWTRTGTQATQQITRYRLEDLTTPINDPEPVGSSTQAGYVLGISPAYYPRTIDTGGQPEVLDYRTYRDVVESWDDVDREAIPGAPDHLTTYLDWSLTDDAGVAPPQTGPISLIGGGSPFPRLRFTVPNRGDNFKIWRAQYVDGIDGEALNVSGPCHVEDYLIGGSEEAGWEVEYVDWTAAPNTHYRYRPQRVSDHRGSAEGEPVEIITETHWVWMAHPALKEWIRLLEADIGEWVHAEPNSTSYAGMDSGYYSRIKGNRHAVHTTISGQLWAIDDAEDEADNLTVNQQHLRFFRMQISDEPILLATPHEVIEVTLGEPADTPLDGGDVELPRIISAEVWQTGPGTLTSSDFLDPGQVSTILIDFESYDDGDAITAADPSGLIESVTGNVKAEADAAMDSSTMGAILKNTVDGVWIDLFVNPTASTVEVRSKGITALPSADRGVLRWSSSAGVLGSARFGTSGSLQLRDLAGNVIAKSTAQVEPNQRWRIIGRHSWFNGESWFGAEIYIGDNYFGDTPDAAIYARLEAAAGSDRVRVGSTATPGYDLSVDNIYLLDSTAADAPSPLDPGDPGGPVGSHEFTLMLTDTPTTAVVSASYTKAGEFGMAWSTSPTMTAPHVLAPAEPNDEDSRIVKHRLTGLPVNTQIYCQPTGADGVLFGKIRTFITSPSSPTADVTRSVLVWSCQRTANGDPNKYDLSFPAWQKMIDIQEDVGVDLVVGQGDTGYWGASLTGADPIAKHIDKYRKQFAGVTLMEEIHGRAESLFQVSDHETGPNSNDNYEDSPFGSVTRKAIDAYLELFPVWSGLYGDDRTPKKGRWFAKNLTPNIRVISTDFRSLERSLQADEDGASKRALGLAQMTWLAAELAGPAALKIILSDTGWGPADAFDDLPPAQRYEDKWWCYQWSQKLIAAMVCDPNTGVHNATDDGGLVNVDLWVGDRHSLTYTAEDNNVLATGEKCGFPVLTCSGTDQHGLGLKNGETYDQFYGGDPDWQVRQFMHVLLHDDGAGTITRVANGWSGVPDPSILSPVVQPYDPQLVIDATDEWEY